MTIHWRLGDIQSTSQAQPSFLNPLVLVEQSLKGSWAATSSFALYLFCTRTQRKRQISSRMTIPAPLLTRFLSSELSTIRSITINSRHIPSRWHAHIATTRGDFQTIDISEWLAFRKKVLHQKRNLTAPVFVPVCQLLDGSRTMIPVVQYAFWKHTGLQG